MAHLAADGRLPSPPPPGTALNPMELAAIASLLAEAADRHAEHGSNDFVLADTYGHRSLVQNAEFHDSQTHGNPASRVAISVVDGQLATRDYCVMRYLADRARDPSRQPGSVELHVAARLLSALAADEFGEYAQPLAGNEDFSLPATAEGLAFLHGVQQLHSLAAPLAAPAAPGVATVEVHTVHALAHLARRCADAAHAPPSPHPAPMAPAPLLPPLGPLARWTSEKALARNARATLDHRNADVQVSVQALRDYAQGGNPFKDLIDESKPRPGPLFLPVTNALNTIAQVGYERTAYLLFSGQPVGQWLPEYERAAAYRYWSWSIDCQERGTWMTVFLNEPVDLLSDCLTLGWAGEARAVAEATRAIYARRLMAPVQHKASQPLNHWLLRVAFDHWNLPFDGWGKGKHPDADPADVFAPHQCLGEPVLNTVFDHWRDAALAPLSDHLAWLCDYYTHRTRAQQFIEFSNSNLRVRFPAALLAWVRLRELQGLAPPAIDHPLMNAPWAQLPAPRAPYSDPLLDAVLARLRREELPHLGTARGTGTVQFVDARRPG